jgi:signal transduction histidine kinase/CheY-like chemotaxis protein
MGRRVGNAILAAWLRRWPGELTTVSQTLEVPLLRRTVELHNRLLLLILPVTAAAAAWELARGKTAIGLSLTGSLVALGICYALGRSRHASSGLLLTTVTMLVGCFAAALMDLENPLWSANIGIVALLACLLLPLGRALLVCGAALVGSAGLLALTAEVAPRQLLHQAATGWSLVGLALVFARHRDRVEAERAAVERRREAALAEARRLESIGRLAGGIAHDFNNLLTVVATNAALLRGAAGGSTSEIELAAQRGAELVHQLLAYSRRQVVEPRLLSLATVVEGIEPMIERLVGSDVELSVELDAGVWPVRADPVQVEQVVVNLVSNARDAMPEGGRLRIAVYNEHSPAGTEQVVLQVADSGAGMDPSTLTRVFEPFFTTKPAGKGTGLGLATVEGIVKQSGGDIAVTSAPGRGTEFLIRFPRAPGELAAAVAGEPAVKVEPAARQVLLVEDDVAVARAVTQLLAAGGFEVTVAHDPEEARGLFGRHHGRIDVLVTDVTMPKESGLSLAAGLRQLEPTLPVVLLSGRPPDAADCPELPGARFLAKPFSGEALFAAIQAATQTIAAAPEPAGQQCRPLIGHGAGLA